MTHPRRLPRRRTGDILLVAAAVVLLVLIAAVNAWAHGEAAWIMENPAYVRPSGAHCCSPVDCARLSDDDVEAVTPGEWRIRSTGQTFRQGDKGVYPAIRPGYWGCKPGAEYVCFFFDGGGA